MFVLILSFSVNASCCQFKDPKNTYFELGNWDKATYFCSKMSGVTGYSSSYSQESCSDISIPAGYCDGWTECNTNIPSPVIISGGGSSSNIKTCIESWKCNDYGSCIDNVKSRSCYDIYNCGTSLNKPIEKESCISQGNFTSNESNLEELQNKDNDNNYLNQITGAVVGRNILNFNFIAMIIILFVISLGIMFFRLRKS